MNEIRGLELKYYLDDKDDESIIEFFKTRDSLKLDEFLIVILALKNDYLRCKMFDHYSVLFNEFDLKAIKKLFTNDELKTIGYEFLNKMKPSFIPLKAIFVVATQDRDLIIKSFKEAPSDEQKMEYVKNVHYCYGNNSELEKYLISMLNDEQVKYLLDTNNPDKRNTYLNSNSKMLTLGVSSDITIGVELETINENIKKFKNVPSLFENFDVTLDGSVKNGLEVVSPILHYNIDDLTTLEALCNVLQSVGFTTDDTCGGHIHIGANYLKTKEDYAIFLYLFSNCEDIIYKITDKACSQKRLGILKYASKIKNDFIMSVANGTLDNAKSCAEYINTLKKITKTRYCGLNLQNINNPDKNTIEFRMANGEIDFKELIANINLFAKLIQISHDLNTFDNSNFKIKLAKKIGEEHNEERRFEILINLLFDTEEERKIYRERYDSNTKIMELVDGISTDLTHELISINSERKLGKITF